MNNDRRSEIAAAFPLLADALAKLAEARELIESARDEEQEYLDAMPDGLKNGDKGQTAEAAIQNLEEALDGIDQIDARDILRALEDASDRSAAVDAAPAKLSAEEAEQRQWDRLPQWAKDRIGGLERNIASVKADMAGMFSDATGAPAEAVVADYVSPLKGKVIPCERIEFPAYGIVVYVEEGYDGVTITSKNGQLALLPKVSNITIVKRVPFG